jgi:hypothetical protein
MASMYENLDRVDISVTVHSREILKIVKSTCHGIKKTNARLCSVIEMSILPHSHSCHIYFRTLLLYLSTIILNRPI